jgi:hypothetical protein
MQSAKWHGVMAALFSFLDGAKNINVGKDFSMALDAMR